VSSGGGWSGGGGGGGEVPRPERCENIFSPSEKRVRKRPPHSTGALPIETSGYGIERVRV